MRTEETLQQKQVQSEDGKLNKNRDQEWNQKGQPFRRGL